MNLKQRRAKQTFEEDEMPALRQKMMDALGTEAELEMDWDSLVVDGWEHMLSEHIRKVFFESATKGFELVGSDEMGKQAMAEGISKIVMQNRNDNYSDDKWAVLKDGTLTLDHHPYSNVDYVQKRAEGLQEVLENNL